MNVVIVAGGLGTRFEELSVFPKILLPTSNYPSIIHEDIERFKNHNVYLIINDKFYSMTKNYLDINNLNINLIRSVNSNGSYNTIKAVYDLLPKENVLFVWSDLILNENLPEFTNNTVVTYNGNYRYMYKDNSIYNVEDYNGNIPGIYYINNLEDIFNIPLDEFDNLDLVDVIKDNVTDFYEYQLKNNLKEYRDLSTYINVIKGEKSNVSLKTRFFNTMIKERFEDNETLVKRATDKKYYNLIRDEYNWYSNLGFDNNLCPKIYSRELTLDNTVVGFRMKFLDGYIPLHQHVKNCLESNDYDKIQLTYSIIKQNLDVLHKSSLMVEKSVFETDLKKELVDKVIKRCDDIEHMLLNYDKEYMVSLLTKVYDIIIDEYKDVDNVEYNFCHGDLNGSNIMVNPESNDVKFIDPRGYFGNTKLYGWKEYEYSKLLYCLSGYDDFNNLPQIYKYDEPIPLKCINQIDYLNKRIYKLIVGVIYVALAGYISQNIMKANIAYEYGIKILEKELNG